MMANVRSFIECLIADTRSGSVHWEERTQGDWYFWECPERDVVYDDAAMGIPIIGDWVQRHGKRAPMTLGQRWRLRKAIMRDRA